MGVSMGERTIIDDQVDSLRTAIAAVIEHTNWSIAAQHAEWVKVIRALHLLAEARQVLSTIELTSVQDSQS